MKPCDSHGTAFGHVYGSSDSILRSSRNPIEGLSYDTVETTNLLRKERQVEDAAAARSRRKLADDLLHFLCVLFLSLCVASIGILIHRIVFLLLAIKNEITTSLMYSGQWIKAFCSYISLGVLFALLAFVSVCFELSAVGSGIPEIKSFLNGVNLNTAFRPRVLMAKMFSVTFAVASGLFIGPDGPMLHIGAIVGVAISKIFNRFKLSHTIIQHTSSSSFATFGTAAAMAASFRAPIGGTIFALEEGASHWTAATLLGAFTCAYMAYLFVVIINKTLGLGGEDISSNFSFGKFSQIYSGHMDYQMIEIALFALVGVAGGLLGALFVIWNKLCIRFRSRFFGLGLGHRFAEIMIVAMLTAWLCFTLPIIWSKCTLIPNSADTYLSNDEIVLISNLVQYNCPHGEYNQAASLLFVDSNVAVKMLFHLREHLASQTFSVETLAIVFFPYYIFSIFTCGVTAAVGTFIPLLISGALMGRIIGTGLMALFPNVVADSGVYALVGAAAMLGGACRSIASITVVLMETTGNLQFALPLMVSLISARIVGNLFSDGLYTSICASKDYSYLPERLSDLGIVEHSIVADFMTKDVVIVARSSSVSHIIQVLKHTSHNLFPVIENSKLTLVGTVKRCDLIKLLMEQSRGGNMLCTADVVKRLTGRVDSEYDKKLIDALDAVVIDGEQVFDLTDIMDCSPFVVWSTSSMQRSYSLFRGLGLRHLVVINAETKVVGILTRRNFSSSIQLVIGNDTRNPLVSKRRRFGIGGSGYGNKNNSRSEFELNPYVSRAVAPPTKYSSLGHESQHEDGDSGDQLGDEKSSEPSIEGDIESSKPGHASKRSLNGKGYFGRSV